MENASEEKIENFNKTILSLARNFKKVNSHTVSNLLDKYEKIPNSQKDISKLEKKLLKSCPQLFLRSFLSGKGQELSLDRIGDNEEKDLDYLFESIKRSLFVRKKHIEKIKKRVKILFPKEKFKYSFRIKDFQSFKNNFFKFGSQKSLIDIIGIRLVPEKNSLFLKMISDFEDFFKDDIAFKLNTFSFSKKEFTKKIGKSSKYYRAIHYYFLIDDFYLEVQMRTPAINQWSILHHDTIYKPKVKLSEEEKKQIMKFGIVATIIDYFELQNNSYSSH